MIKTKELKTKISHTYSLILSCFVTLTPLRCRGRTASLPSRQSVRYLLGWSNKQLNSWLMPGTRRSRITTSELRTPKRAKRPSQVCCTCFYSSRSCNLLKLVQDTSRSWFGRTRRGLVEGSHLEETLWCVWCVSSLFSIWLLPRVGVQLFTPWQHLFTEARSSECTNQMIHQPTTVQSYSDFTKVTTIFTYYVYKYSCALNYN